MTSLSETRLDINLVTFNIKGMLGCMEQIQIFEKMAQKLKGKNIDILCLQEVFLAKNKTFLTIGSLQKDFPYATFGGNASFESGQLGNAVLSRFPIIQTSNFDLSVKSQEQRGCLHCILALPERHHRTLNLLVIHLGLRHWERLTQFHFIQNYIASIQKYNQSIVLAGDFNDWAYRLPPNIKYGEIILKDAYVIIHGRRARTFPAIAPLFPLDRIYFSELILRKAQVWRHQGWRFLSDHLPLYVGLTSPLKE